LEPQAQIIWQEVFFSEANDGLGPVGLGCTNGATGRLDVRGKWSPISELGRVGAITRSSCSPCRRGYGAGGANRSSPPRSVLETGAHVRVMGKGRKERCTPLSKNTRSVLVAWLREPPRQPDQPVFPNARGGRLSAHGVHYLLAKHVTAATRTCPSLSTKRVSPHVLRHAAAMDLLHQGIDRSVISLWLGHESIETTQMYLDADLELKQRVLDTVVPPNGKPGRYRPDDKLLAFLNSL
jgi:hypothetical protein